MVCLAQRLLSRNSSNLNPAPAQLASNPSAPKSVEGKKAVESADVTSPRPLLPIDGRCPSCSRYVVWGDLVRQLSVACAQSRGNDRTAGVWTALPHQQQHLSSDDDEEEEEDDHWSNMMTQK